MKIKRGMSLFLGMMIILQLGLVGCAEPEGSSESITHIEQIAPADSETAAQSQEGTALNQEQNQGENALEGQASEDVMELHFIDIGQGDATLIKNGEHAMLIDAGDNEHGVALQLYLQKQGVEKLDYLILTHPDSDHIGGADVILYKLPVDRVFHNSFEKDNNTVQDVKDAMVYRYVSETVPEVGDSYAFGDADFTFLAPVKEYSDVNDSSLVVMLQKGERTFLFTGDCGEDAEQDILDAGMNVDADLYQAGHHGSRYASGQKFLEAVSPSYTVISCLMGNEYGYPHAKLLNRLRESGCRVYRTDEQGSVVAYCDGKSITFNCAPSDTWKTGEDRRNSVTIEPESVPVNPICYVVNKNSGVIHKSDCEKLPGATNQVIFESFEDAKTAGYEKCCGNCKPEK